MQKITSATLLARARATRAELLATLDGVPETVLRAPGALGPDSIADWLAYLGAWGDVVNKGLREIQRDKKPTELLRAADDQAAFRRAAIDRLHAEPLETTFNRLDDALFHLELRLNDLTYDDLNQLKRHRWLGNRPLWPLLAGWSYEHEAAAIATIAACVRRAQVDNAVGAGDNS